MMQARDTLVTLAKAQSLNPLLVKQGLAWWYHQYSKDRMLGELEIEANVIGTRRRNLGIDGDVGTIRRWCIPVVVTGRTDLGVKDAER